MTIARVLGTICLFIILAVLVYVVYKDSIGKEKQRKVAKKIQNPLKSGPEELVNPPTIFIRLPGKKKYYHYEMKKPTISIGTGKNNDIVIFDDNTVEIKHAVIKKVMKHNRSFYEFINYAKTNPSQYRNASREGKYEIMGYKDGQELEQGTEYFYVGQTKLMIKIPQEAHGHTDTDIVKKKMDLNDAAHEEKAERIDSERIDRDDYKEDSSININNSDPYDFHL